MADERINIDITANNQRAKESMDDLKALSKELQNLEIDVKMNIDGTKGVAKEFEQLATGDKISASLDSYMNRYVKFLEKTLELQKEISRYERMNPNSPKVDRGPANRELRKELDRRSKPIKDFERITGKELPLTSKYANLRTRPSDVAARVEDTQLTLTRLKDERRRFEDLGDTGRTTGILNHTQASKYRQSRENFMRNYHGIEGFTEEQIADPNFKFEIQEDEVAPNSVRGQALKGIVDAGDAITELEGQLEEVFNSEHLNAEQSLAAQQSITEQIKEQRKLLETNKSIIASLDASLKSVKAEEQKMRAYRATEGDVQVTANEKSLRGRMISRSAASAMALIGSVGYAVTGRYNRGVTTTKGLMPDSQEIGFRTGNTDFRSVRLDGMDSGIDYGYTGQQMLDFQDSILNTLGFTSQRELEDMARGDSQFTKLSGVEDGQAKAFNETLYASGGISNRDQIKAIQEGFVGGIRASGMEGREKEQIQALSTLIDTVSDGREMSNEELNNRMTLAALMSATGSRALQGANLEYNMGSLDSFYQDAGMFSTQSLLMGGPGAYGGGFAGYFRQREEVAKGFTAERFNEALTYGNKVGGGDPEAVMGVLHSMWGGSVSEEAVRALVESFPEGISQEELDTFMQDNQLSGEEELTDRDEAYSESTDQLRESNDRLAEKIESLLNENAIADGVQKIVNAINSSGAGGTGSAFAHTALTGIATGLSTFAGNLAWAGLSDILIKGASTTLGSGGSFLMEGMKGLGGRIAGGLGIGGLGAKLGTGIQGAAPAVGQYAPWAATAFRGIEGIANIAQSDNKLHTGTSEVGGIAGTLLGGKGGAALGASIGTAILPGIGTAIGTIAGSIGGSWLGDKAGTGLGDWLGGKIFGEGSSGLVKKVSAGELEPGESVYGDNSQYATSTQEEMSAQERRHQAEVLRQSNISLESENLSLWENLLGRISTLLDKARAQNGIIGTMNASGMGGGGGGLGGTLSSTEPGTYWTNQDITKHDLGVTSNALTAEELDKWIDANAPSNSLMRGMGSTYMKAGAESGLDPRYLVAHSALETGWGTSSYAKAGNFFGIGAFDNNPDNALNYGNNSASSGIIEGAKWIAENYYGKGNKTLSDMHSAGYATDPGWASKIANMMKGSEKHTSPSTVSINTTVNYTGSGNPEADGRALARGINDRFTSEYKLAR